MSTQNTPRIYQQSFKQGQKIVLPEILLVKTQVSPRKQRIVKNSKKKVKHTDQWNPSFINDKLQIRQQKFVKPDQQALQDAMDFRKIEKNYIPIEQQPQEKWNPSFINDRLPLDKKLNYLQEKKNIFKINSQRSYSESQMKGKFGQWNQSFINEKLQIREIKYQKPQNIVFVSKLQKVAEKKAAKHTSEWNPSFVNDKMEIRKILFKKDVPRYPESKLKKPINQQTCMNFNEQNNRKISPQSYRKGIKQNSNSNLGTKYKHKLYSSQQETNQQNPSLYYQQKFTNYPNSIIQQEFKSNSKDGDQLNNLEMFQSSDKINVQQKQQNQNNQDENNESQYNIQQQEQ